MKSIFKKKPVAVAILLAITFPVLAADHHTDIHEPQEKVSDNYSGDAIQILGDEADGQSEKSHFEGHAHQTIEGEEGTLYSLEDDFTGDAFQQVIKGIAERANFAGHAKQYVGNSHDDAVVGNTAGLSRHGTFTDFSAQYLGLKGDFTGNPENNNYALSEDERFAENASQTLYGVSQANSDTFSDNAAQTLYDEAATRNGTFTDMARQELHDASQSDGDSFGDDASQTLFDKAASRNAKFSGSALQELNGVSHAQSNSFADSATQVLHGNATAAQGKFADRARQQLSGDSQTDGDSFSGDAAQSLSNFSAARQATFADRAHQELHDYALAQDNMFSGSSSQALYDSTLARNNLFSGNARQELHDISKSDGAYFTDSAAQAVYLQAVALNGVFSADAQQALHEASQASDNSFSGQAAQKLYDAASTRNGSFNGAASQALYDTSRSVGDTFSADAVQTLFDQSSAQNGQFAGHAGQVLNATSQAGGSRFTENAAQTLYDNALTQDGNYAGDATQTVYGAARSVGDTFNEHARQTLVSGVSRNATFNQSAVFSAQGGVVDNATLNDHAAGFVNGTAALTGRTTVNDAATLHITANDQTKAEDILLNNSTLVIDAADANQNGSSTHVDFLTLNNGTIRFATANNGKYTALNAHQLDGSGGTLYFNNPYSASVGNYITADAISGHYHLSVDDSASLGDRLDLISVTSAGKNNGTYDLINRKGEKIDGVDMHVYVGKLTRDPDHPDDVILRQDTTTTTRSTDALLGALSSGLFIADGEMQNVRARRGDMQSAEHNAGGVWGRYLTGVSHVRAAGSAGYRLQQNGVELGGDKIVDIGNDRLALGLFGSYSTNDLKQDRGNTSGVESWGGGIYTTWLGAGGYYVDGMLTYNHFSTAVRSHSETGVGVNGSFTQNGVGAALETGYRFNLPAAIYIEPYARTTYFTADGKDVQLSNGLEAKADRLQSLRGEAGVTMGKRFDLNNGMSLSPYTTVALEQEFIRHNAVTMGETARFNNDFSGTTGRYGAGISAQLTGNASVYSEVSYRKGSHVESPLTANAGVRVDF